MTVLKREYKDHKKDVWYYAFWFNRRRIRKSGFTTKRQAELAEAKQKNGLYFEGQGVGGKIKDALMAVFDRVLTIKSQDRAINTIRSIRSRRSPIASYFGTKRLDHISSEDIEGYKSFRIANGISNRSINHELSALSQVFKYAHKSKIISYNPMWQVEKLKEKEVDLVLPTHDQVQRFLDEVLKTRFGYQLYVWFHVLAFTGLRPAESLNLKWTDIDFESNELHVRRTLEHQVKTRKPRSINMNSILREVLLMWRNRWEAKFQAGQPHQWVFFHPQMPTQRAKGFRTAIKNARNRAGLPELHPYVFRHLFCSEAIKSGAERHVIKEWMGHNSLQMMDRKYSHFTPAFRKSEMEKVSILGLNTPNPAQSCNQIGPVVAPPEKPLIIPTDISNATDCK